MPALPGRDRERRFRSGNTGSRLADVRDDVFPASRRDPSRGKAQRMKRRKSTSAVAAHSVSGGERVNGI